MVLMVVVTIGVIAGIAGGAYFLGQRSTGQSATTILPGGQPSITSITTQPSTYVSPQIAQDPLFTGKVTKITRDLGLFKITDIDKENGILGQIVYYEAGIFARGALRGYTRVLATRPSGGPGPSMQYILATQDFTTYVLDDPQNKTTKYPETDYDNPYQYLDKTKIFKTMTFDTDHPQTIALEKPYGLMGQGNVLIESKNTRQKDKNGYEIYQDEPVTEFDGAASLTSPLSQLSFHAETSEWGTGDAYPPSALALLNIRNKYLHLTTYVFASDSTGLAYSYVLAAQKDIDTYLSALPAYEEKMIAYKKQVALAQDKKSNDYPDYPEGPSFPGMQLTKSSGGLPDGYYLSYGAAFPGACGGNQTTDIVDTLKDTDLELVSSSSVYPLYILKDTQHPLYKLQYETKMGIDDESFKGMNEGMTKPTFEGYVTKHPLLFFKDIWSRWGVMGEFDIKLIGGCGKPVVYLYPKKPTDVHLSFASLVSLDTQIPTYQGGWFVNASPDGTLTDLQPQYTNCADIDGSQFGSEYAAKACMTNTYPYIYWSGKSEQHPYPKVEGGWIVDRTHLGAFMHMKLKAIGLTDKESNDMTSYWIPKMDAKNAPYYRVSFIQTKEMNAFIPMNVYPQPDSVLRVFLDWQPLSAKPVVDPKPQQLEKFVRNGFTYVEWGGLK